MNTRNLLLEVSCGVHNHQTEYMRKGNNQQYL